MSKSKLTIPCQWDINVIKKILTFTAKKILRLWKCTVHYQMENYHKVGKNQLHITQPGKRQENKIVFRISENSVCIFN